MQQRAKLAGCTAGTQRAHNTQLRVCSAQAGRARSQIQLFQPTNFKTLNLELLLIYENFLRHFRKDRHQVVLWQSCDTATMPKQVKHIRMQNPHHPNTKIACLNTKRDTPGAPPAPRTHAPPCAASSPSCRPAAPRPAPRWPPATATTGAAGDKGFVTAQDTGAARPGPPPALPSSLIHSPASARPPSARGPAAAATAGGCGERAAPPSPSRPGPAIAPRSSAAATAPPPPPCSRWPARPFRPARGRHAGGAAPRLRGHR